jgi:hypothetical protein
MYAYFFQNCSPKPPEKQTLYYTQIEVVNIEINFKEVECEIRTNWLPQYIDVMHHEHKYK